MPSTPTLRNLKLFSDESEPFCPEQNFVPWVPDSHVLACTRCQRPFTTVRRRHHCRVCGDIFCVTCSSHSRKIRHSPVDYEVRVCDVCVLAVDASESIYSQVLTIPSLREEGDKYWTILTEQGWPLVKPLLFCLFRHLDVRSSTCRSFVWEILTGSQQAKEQSTFSYREIRKTIGETPVAGSDDEWSKRKIRRDVPRSMPTNDFVKYFGLNIKNRQTVHFEKNPKMMSMYRILRCYSKYDHRVVSYCQGLNYIVTTLMMMMDAYGEVNQTQLSPRREIGVQTSEGCGSNGNSDNNDEGSQGVDLDTLAADLENDLGSDADEYDDDDEAEIKTEEQVFWMLVRILDDYGIGRMYLDDAPDLHRMLALFDFRFHEALPDVAARLKAAEISSDAFAIEWITTLFVMSPLAQNFQVLLKAWDLFMAGGLDTVIDISVAMLRSVRKEVLAAADEELLPVIRGLAGKEPTVELFDFGITYRRLTIADS